MIFKYFSRQIYFSRTLQDSPVYSSTFQACANPFVCIFTVKTLFQAITMRSTTISSSSNKTSLSGSSTGKSSTSIAVISRDVMSDFTTSPGQPELGILTWVKVQNFQNPEL